MKRKKLEQRDREREKTFDGDFLAMQLRIRGGADSQRQSHQTQSFQSLTETETNKPTAYFLIEHLESQMNLCTFPNMILFVSRRKTHCHIKGESEGV